MKVNLNENNISKSEKRLLIKLQHDNIKINKDNRVKGLEGLTLSTQKAIVKDITLQVAKVKEYRHARTVYSSNTFKENLVALKIVRLDRVIDNKYGSKYADGIVVTNADINTPIRFATQETTDYNYYAKSCRWNKTTTQGLFQIDNKILDGLKLSDTTDSEIEIDGIINLGIISKKVLNNGVVIRKANILHRTKTGFIIEQSYIASVDVNDVVYHYHHKSSVKQAVKGLGRKVKKIIAQSKFKDNKPFLNLTDMISRQDYAMITGACNLGIKDFCNQNSIGSKILVSELLTYLKKHDYGYTKFKSVIIS